MGGSIKFGPLREGPGSISAYDFLLGPIVVVDAAGATETLDGRNGIEAMALANFRDDLEQMLEHGHGLLFFGDHDFGQIAELEIIRPGVVRVLANLASRDRFDITVGELAVFSLNEIVEQVNRVESMSGPLTGWLGARRHRRGDRADEQRCRLPRLPRWQAGVPPDDCGGPSGYGNLLAAISDPTHEEHEELTEWLPPGFDADEFDVAEATEMMRSARPLRNW